MTDLSHANSEREYRDFLDQYYASLYADGSDNNRNHHCTTAIIEYLEQAPGPSSPLTCMDIGFGRGSLLKYFVSRGWRATGVEIARTEYQTCLEGLPGLDLFFGGYLDFATDDTFDLVVDNGTFHHQHPDDQTAYLRRVADQLAVGGRFLLSTYHAGDTKAEITDVIEDGRFRTCFNTAMLNALFKKKSPRLQVQRYIPILREGRDLDCALFVVSQDGQQSSVNRGSNGGLDG